MAGRTGHLAFAGAFERHQMRLRDVEQDVAGVCLRLGASLAVGVNEGDAHQLTPCSLVAFLIAVSPSRNSVSLVSRPQPRPIEAPASARPADPRVRTECVTTCRSRWSPEH